MQASLASVPTWLVWAGGGVVYADQSGCLEGERAIFIAFSRVQSVLTKSVTRVEHGFFDLN
jgi:hypothetical protein